LVRYGKRVILRLLPFLVIFSDAGVRMVASATA